MEPYQTNIVRINKTYQFILTSSCISFNALSDVDSRYIGRNAILKTLPQVKHCIYYHYVTKNGIDFPSRPIFICWLFFSVSGMSDEPSPQSYWVDYTLMIDTENACNTVNNNQVINFLAGSYFLKFYDKLDKNCDCGSFHCLDNTPV